MSKEKGIGIFIVETKPREELKKKYSEACEHDDFDEFEDEIECESDDESDEDEYTSPYLEIRCKILSQMTVPEIKALDLLDNYANSMPADLPVGKEKESIESRLEHAEWNNSDLHRRIIHTLAIFESAVAYYATMVEVEAGEEDIDASLDGVLDAIELIVDTAREVELLERITIEMYKKDHYKAKLKEMTAKCDEMANQIEIYKSKLAAADAKCTCLSEQLIEHCNSVSYDNTEDDDDDED